MNHLLLPRVKPETATGLGMLRPHTDGPAESHVDVITTSHWPPIRCFQEFSSPLGGAQENPLKDCGAGDLSR